MSFDEKYLDRQVTSADPQSHKSKVRLGTAAALPAYTNSAAGELTASANGALPNIDGVAPALNDSIFLTTDGSASDSDNGIYVVTQLGDGSNPWILTRRGDANADDLMPSGIEFRVDEGSTYAGKKFYLSTPDPIVVDTTNLTFTEQVAGGGSGSGDLWVYDASTADSDPGAGNFRLNNADPSLATFIYIDNSDVDGSPGAIGVGNRKPGDAIQLKDAADSSIWALYLISDFPTAAAPDYARIPVTYAGGNGTLSTGETFGFQIRLLTDDGYVVDDLLSIEKVKVPLRRKLLYGADLNVGDGDLVVEGSLETSHDPENHTIAYVGIRQTRVIHANEVMNYNPNNLVVDGDLIIDGDLEPLISDGQDVLDALTDVAPDTPSILGATSPTNFLSPAEARTVMDVYSTTETDSAISAGSFTPGLYDGLQIQTEAGTAFTGVVGKIMVPLTGVATMTLPPSAGLSEGDTVGLGANNLTALVEPGVGDTLVLADLSVVTNGAPVKRSGGPGTSTLAYYVWSALGGVWTEGTDAAHAHMASGSHRMLITDSLDDFDDVTVADNSVVGRSGGNITSVTAGVNTILGRAGGNLTAMPVVNTNSLLLRTNGSLTSLTMGTNSLLWRRGGNISAFSIGSNQMVGRNGSADSSSLNPYEVVRNLYVNGTRQVSTQIFGTFNSYNGGSITNWFRCWQHECPVSGTSNVVTINGIEQGDTNAEFVPIKYFWNSSTDGTVLFMHEDGSAGSAAERIRTPNGLTYVLPPQGAVLLVRDIPTDRWIVVADQNRSSMRLLTETLSSNQNDWDPGSASEAWRYTDSLRINCTVASDVTGFFAYSAWTSTTTAMHRVKLYNVGTANVTLRHQNGSSVASYRLLNNTGADIVLAPDETIDMLYDPVTGRWRVG